MISTFLKPVWLGYFQTGGAADLRIDELRGRLLFLGGRASEMASLFAYASRDAGLKPLVLDTEGSLVSRVSGYLPSYRLPDILYDLYRMNEDGQRAHGELLASAYTAALDLTFEEEAIMDAAMQQLASQDNMASPPVVYDALSSVEGFRGFYVDKLKGRIGALKFLDAVDSASLAQLLAHHQGAIVDVSGSDMPRAAELGAALLIAKLVATMSSRPPSEGPDFILVNGAHRVFKGFPRIQHGNRLLTALLESRLTSVFSSDQAQVLSPLVGEACPTKILSADVWNHLEVERVRRSSPSQALANHRDRPMPPPTPPVLPNSFVLVHGFYGSAQPFIPRPFEAKTATKRDSGNETTPSVPADAPPPGGDVDADPVMTKRILQEVKAYESPSMPSVIGFLSGEFPKVAIQIAIDSLEREGYVKLSPKEQKSGRTMLAIELTPKGIELPGRLG